MKKLLLFLFLLPTLLRAQSEACPAPINLKIIDATATTVTLGWTEIGTAVTWELNVYDEQLISNQPTYNNFVTNNPYIITNLPPDCLSFQLRSNCKNTSPWSEKIYLGCPPGYPAYMGLAEIKSDKENDFQLYPNPAKNQFSINITNPTDSINGIIIYDIIGKKVNGLEKLSTQQITINTLDLETGLYFVEITSLSGIKSVKKLILK